MLATLNNYKKGFILLEILVAITVIGIAFAALLSVGTQALNLSSSVRAKTQIDFLIREEIEALRTFRDGTIWATNGLGIVNTGINNPYHMHLNEATNPGKWELVAGVETVGAFTRSIVFDKVSRDALGEIESDYNQSREDVGTKKITVNVMWMSKTYQVMTYFTNWQND